MSYSGYDSPAEITIERSCDYEISGTDDGTGSEVRCTFEGEVTGELLHEELFWVCPSCNADHTENF